MCWPRKQALIWEHYQTEILPAQAHRLQGIVRQLKLVGRGRPTAFILRELERYTELASNRHEIFGYVEPDAVWDRVAACDRYCEACGYCEAAFRAANPDFSLRRSRWMIWPAGERDPCAPRPDMRTHSAGPPRHRAS